MSFDHSTFLSAMGLGHQQLETALSFPLMQKLAVISLKTSRQLTTHDFHSRD